MKLGNQDFPQTIIIPFKTIIVESLPVTGFDSLEESPPQRVPGTDQERGREEEDREKDEG